MALDKEIAIVGIGCRFPGADNIDEFWRVLVNGENHVKDIPADRWNKDAFYSDNKDEPGKHYVKKAGFLKRHDEWDNRLFGISDNEAARIDPQQRYVLECTHMATEDGGITRKDLKGTKTGVYIGVMNDDFKVCSNIDHQLDSNYTATGQSTTIIASRVSFVYDLRGPCMVIDTACSSAMTAIHLGSQAIQTGVCDMAICGGVSSIIGPDMFIPLCKARMMSAIGQCQTFCDTADGYARGEGCGIVILKSVEQSLKDKNKIWAVLKIESNQDGRTAQPMTAPSGVQQEKLLHEIYSKNGIDPTSLQYIECHGTGTPVGDPVEVNALGKFIASYRDKKEVENFTSNTLEMREPKKEECSEYEQIHLEKELCSIPIGSVKSNIGHTESAAGAAGIIKTVLMMKHGKFVPSLHLKRDMSNLNKNIKLEEYGLDISLDVSEWKPNKFGERVGCVNSFGFGGSNSHVIVIQNESLNRHSSEVSEENTYNLNHVICLSSVDRVGLKNTLENFLSDIQTDEHPLRDISYTSVYRRDHYTYKTAVFGKSRQDIKNQVEAKLKHLQQLRSVEPVRLVFVFSGVGTTWQGMCREMMATQPVFRDKVYEIDTFLTSKIGWSMADKFENDTDYSDPVLNHIAIFCTQVALFALWKSWGLDPDVIIGQSVGEVAAAYASGAINLCDAVSVICIRSKLLAEVTGGTMMVVGNYPLEKIESICKQYDNRVSIAVYNSPTSCTLSGDADVMHLIKESLESLNEQILLRTLPVQCAYHSKHVDSCVRRIEEGITGINKNIKVVDHISTVTGTLSTGEEFQTGSYWAENVRRPVMFMQAVLTSCKDDVLNIFLELGPKQVLRVHLPNILKNNTSIQGICLPSLNAKKENSSMYQSLCELFEVGCGINWNRVVPTEGITVSVPKYIFNKTKSLFIPEKAMTRLNGIAIELESHLYVRSKAEHASKARIEISKGTTPFIYDHRFMNSILVPGSTYIEAAFEVAQKCCASNVYEISIAIEFLNPFTPQGDKQYNIDIELSEDNKVSGQRFFMESHGQPLCRGLIIERVDEERLPIDIEEIRNGCTLHRSKRDCYIFLERLSFQYADSLRVIEQSWVSKSACFVELLMPQSIKAQQKNTHFHPAVIDAIFQSCGLLVDEGIWNGSPTLPVRVESIVINRPLLKRMFAFCQRISSSQEKSSYNAMLLSSKGHVIAEINGFHQTTMHMSPNNTLTYTLEWKEITTTGELSELKSMQKTNQSFDHFVIFAPKKVIDYFQLCKIDNEVVFIEIETCGRVSEDVYKSTFAKVLNIRAVIFAAIHTIPDMGHPKLVFDVSKHTFKSLSFLMKHLRLKNCSIPLFVLTKDVIHIKEKTKQPTNFSGAELWGMVKSAIAEQAYSDIRIIDIPLKLENAKALDSLIRTKEKFHTEYIIDAGKVYTCELIERLDMEQFCSQREIEFDCTSSNLVLKSAHPEKVTNTSFLLNSNASLGRNCRDTHVILNLMSVSLHSVDLYPVSPDTLNEKHLLWPNVEEKRFSVIALEALGSIKKKQSSKTPVSAVRPSVVVCYPFDVHIEVSVPSKCVFSLKSLPYYVPGMMTVGVLLWTVAEACQPYSSVHVVVDNETSLSTKLFRCILVANKTTKITLETANDMDTSKVGRNSYAKAVVILAQLTKSQVCSLMKTCMVVKSIISLEHLFPRDLQKLCKHNLKTIVFNTLYTDDIFSHNSLVQKAPKVYNFLKSLDNTLAELFQKSTEDETMQRRKGILCLPYPSLKLQDRQAWGERIPLIVSQSEIFQKTGCYIIVGGLSGLGWELLQIMAELGAGYLVTYTRSSVTEEKQKQIDNIQNTFMCTILTFQVDITNLEQLQKTTQELQFHIRGASIKGIFHGGGVISDKLLSNMTEEDIEKPLLPKILGTLNLHVVTMNMHLDFFVMHSSIVSILGNPGQCNYAAGNSFQDAFAHYRRGIGLSGQSINWGALSVGMAVKSATLADKLKRQGFYYLQSRDIRECFLRAIMTNTPQIAFGIFDWHTLGQSAIVQMNPEKFANLLKKYQVRQHDLSQRQHFKIETFNKLNRDEQQQQIKEVIITMVSEAFVIDVRNLNETTQFISLGIDSMAAMGFANSVFEELNIRIPFITLLSETTTIGTLTEYLVENLSNRKHQIPLKAPSLSAVPELPELLQGDITFMQTDLLEDCFADSKSGNFLKQADFEIRGCTIKEKDWQRILNHVISMNTELRRLFFKDFQTKTLSSILLSPSEAHAHLQSVPFDSICSANAKDERQNVVIDVSKDLPIRFKIACRRNTSRVRIFVHSAVSDISSISLICNDIGACTKSVLKDEPLPKKELMVNPAEVIRNMLSPLLVGMKEYWKHQLSENIEPFSFADSINNDLNVANWNQIEHTVQYNVINNIFEYVQNQNTSLYNFITSVYMALIHSMTRKEFISILTNIDMRGHVPQLQKVVARCVNTIPVIFDLRNPGRVKDYFKENTKRLFDMTQNSGYPYKLIKEEMPALLKKHIGRHRIVMDNMTELNKTLQHDGVTVKLMNVFHSRDTYETSLSVLYDVNQRKLSFHFGYNSEAVPHEKANQLLFDLENLLGVFLKDDSAFVLDLLETNTRLSESGSVDAHQTLSTVLSSSCHHTANHNKKFTSCLMDGDVTQKTLASAREKESEVLRPDKTHFILLKKDWFLKQSRNGWDHKVYVTLGINTSKCSNGDVILQWGKKAELPYKHIVIEPSTEIHLKLMNGMFCLMWRCGNRWMVLKTRSREQGFEWLEVFNNI